MDDLKENEINQPNNGENEIPDELEKLKKERNEYLDGWQRAKADLINYKKDEMKRFEMFARLANEELMRELIIILDSFSLAIDALEKDGKVEKGVYMIKAQLEDTLKKFGLGKITVNVGEQFNPAYQEVISVVDSKKESGIILEEIETGYMLNGKLIRPARVKVAK